jgi:hypothetical protein
MSRNGSGTYTLPAGNPVVTGTTISTTWANNTLNDLAAAMTDSVAADGQTPMTGDLDLNSNKIVNLAPAAFAGEAVEYSQLQAATSVVTITGGTINGATIGATTPASGRFTTLEATGAFTAGSTAAITGNTTVGGTLVVTGDGSFNSTGALKVPVGTTAQQPTPVTGHIRYNTTNANFEGYYASGWSSLGSAAGTNTQVQYNNGGVLAGSSAFTFDGTVLTVPKIAFVSSNTPSLTNYQGGALTSGTVVASTSGTSIDFTSIPSWVKRVTVELIEVSTNGTSNFLIQLGTSGGIVSSGYLSGVGSRNNETTSTAGFIVGIPAAAGNNLTGIVPICNYTTNAWTTSGVLSRQDGFANSFGGSISSLGGTLDRIRITTVNGTDTFDAGSINILYE